MANLLQCHVDDLHERSPLLANSFCDSAILLLIEESAELVFLKSKEDYFNLNFASWFVHWVLFVYFNPHSNVSELLRPWCNLKVRGLLLTTNSWLLAGK